MPPSQGGFRLLANPIPERITGMVARMLFLPGLAAKICWPRPEGVYGCHRKTNGAFSLFPLTPAGDYHWPPKTPYLGDRTMKHIQKLSSEPSGEVKALLYRIELSSPTRRIAEEPAISARTLRRWCLTDEEFKAARSLAGELGIRLRH